LSSPGYGRLGWKKLTATHKMDDGNAAAQSYEVYLNYNIGMNGLKTKIKNLYAKT
jgi:hypothetical protein